MNVVKDKLSAELRGSILVYPFNCCLNVSLPLQGNASISKLSTRRKAFASNEGYAENSKSSADNAVAADVDVTVIKGNVDKAAKILNEMIEEISRELFLSEATAYIYNEAADLKENEAIRNCVISKIEFLDSNFLAALNVYIEVARSHQDSLLESILSAMRSEILYQVSLRLPDAARVLEAVLNHTDSPSRTEIVIKSLLGGEGDLPSTSLDNLAATTTQFIDDMEEQDVVADRKLLARLVLIREELRRMSLGPVPLGLWQGALDAPSLQFRRSSVPQRCMVFLKELLQVGDPAGRVSLLTRAFNEDWDGAAPKSSAKSSETKSVSDWVRPGRFMVALNVTLEELKQGNAAGAAPAAILERLEQVREESMVVLDRMQK